MSPACWYRLKPVGIGKSVAEERSAVALARDTPPCRAKNARRGWGTRSLSFLYAIKLFLEGFVDEVLKEKPA